MPMHHHGQVVANRRRSAAERLICFGDVNQVTFQTFSESFEALFGMSLGVYNIMYMSVVHRCRLDAVAAWVDRYDGTLRVCTCCEDVRCEDESLSYVRVRSLGELVRRPGVKYLTFTHHERMKLAKHLGMPADVAELRAMPDGISTVTEFQGETHGDVELVRLEPRWSKTPSEYSPSIYNRMQHALTAMTRHKYTFVYRTVSEEYDEVVRRVEASKCPLRRDVVRGVVAWDDVKDSIISARSADLKAPVAPSSAYSVPYSANLVFGG